MDAMTTYTCNEIFKHMSPATLVSWIADFENAPDGLSDSDRGIEAAATIELFALVGMESVEMLMQAGVDVMTPVVRRTVEKYNED